VKLAVLASVATLSLVAGSAALAGPTVKGAGYFDYDGGAVIVAGGAGGFGGSTTSLPAVTSAFQGISQYDTRAFGRNFIPPDTMGAVGRTQYLETVNGAVAVFDKATGVRTSIQSDVDFWANAGQVGTNGDPRVMYNAASNKWIALTFGSSLSDIQIAVSNTSDALGGWRSTKFTGFAGGIADYPTLAIDKNAVYIGTNNFGGPTNSFKGTTLNVLSLANLLAESGPTTTGLVQFVTPCCAATDDFTRGFAIQGVNSSANTTTGKILAVSIEGNGLTRYDIANAGTAGATRGASTDFLGFANYQSNKPARQPSPVLANQRIIDPSDDRVGSSVWEVNGRIYSVHTVTQVGTDHTVVRYDVIDSATNTVLAEGDIGDATHDYFQGSIAVNELGQVVIGYNRSGLGADGKISFLARTYNTNPNGTLRSTGSELLLKVSDTNDYHNGSIDGQAAAGRQRWGDYSAVSVDPTIAHEFWLIGEYGREPNNDANGHPGGTGGTRFGTYIASINVGSVPEPATWGMMIAGFGLVGAMQRRRRTGYATH